MPVTLDKTDNEAVPYDYADLFQPVLDALKQLGGSGRPVEVTDIIVSRLGITDEMMSVTTKAGVPLFTNRVHWARLYLARSGYIDSSKRGVWSLTDKGRQETITTEKTIEIERRVKKDAAVRAAEKKRDRQERGREGEAEERVGELLQNQGHRGSIKAILHKLPPDGFERLCQRLLRESGFEQVAVTGRSGDGGIDGHGVVQVNPFVSFRVLFQCKRYVGAVGAGTVRDFRGAMMGRADKGIIMTTGTFSQDAKREAVRDGVPPIELVDGDDIVDLFESLELGLTPRKAYEVDEAFFEDFAGT